jgi:uridine kinase
MSIDPITLDQPAAYQPQPNLFREFQSYGSWCKHLDVVDVTSLNRIISEGSANDLITVCEARHEQIIHSIAESVIADSNVKIILISGPSSAGKTTTSKRLRAHLISKGQFPLTVSTDDYFVDREKTPVDESGNIDYESIDALDLERFNHDLISLMEGAETEVPVFDFVEGRRAPKGKMLKLEKGSPLIVEGIHGLNEKLTKDIARKNKCKIYINDLTDLNVDQYNRISTSDVRLIRRIVRDIQKRGNDALATISMWQSVRMKRTMCSTRRWYTNLPY